jgi:hypothetical protein
MDIVIGDFALKEDVDLEEAVLDNEGGENEDSDKEDEGDTQKKKFDSEKIQMVTQENINNFSIHDIVIPMVGREIPYLWQIITYLRLPQESPVTEIINEVLKKNDLTIHDFISADQ